MKLHMQMYHSLQDLTSTCDVVATLPSPSPPIPPPSKDLVLLANEKISRTKITEWKCNYCKLYFHLEVDLNEHVKSHGMYVKWGKPPNNRAKTAAKQKWVIKRAENNQQIKIAPPRSNGEREEIISRARNKCDVCDLWFCHEASLNVHAKLHESHNNGTAGSNKSDFGGGELSPKWTIKRAGPSKHAPSSYRAYKWRCQHCQMYFFLEEDLNKHLLTLHDKDTLPSPLHAEPEEEISFSCVVCKYTAKNKYQMQLHIQMYHGLQMESSAANVSDNDNAKRSEPVTGAATAISRIEATKWRCSYCPLYFHAENDLNEHVKRHNPSELAKDVYKRGFCCDICGESSLYRKYMLVHRSVLHPDATPIDWNAFVMCFGITQRCTGCSRNFKKQTFDQHRCDSFKVGVEQRSKIRNYLANTKPTYKCDICSLCFHWKSLYRRHRELSHRRAAHANWDLVEPVEIQHYCSRCERCFGNESGFITHRCKGRIGKFAPTVCATCNKKFSTNSGYRRHYRKKHLNPVSPKKNKNDGIPKRTLAKAGGEFVLSGNESRSPTRKPIKFKKTIDQYKLVIKCPLCEEKFLRRNLILVHALEAHGRKLATPYLCLVCDKTFNSKHSLDSHNILFHSKDLTGEQIDGILNSSKITVDDVLMYQCSICPKIVTTSNQYIAHYNWHRAERKYTCEMCGKQTMTVGQLNEHKKFTHNDIKYNCRVCGHAYRSELKYLAHVNSHTGQPSYVCEKCGEAFDNLRKFRKHEMKHDDNRRMYACPVCSKTFKYSSAKYTHILVCHSELKTNRMQRDKYNCFECAICGKKLKNRVALKLHVNRHILDNTKPAAKND